MAAKPPERVPASCVDCFSRDGCHFCGQPHTLGSEWAGACLCASMRHIGVSDCATLLAGSSLVKARQDCFAAPALVALSGSPPSTPTNASLPPQTPAARPDDDDDFLTGVWILLLIIATSIVCLLLVAIVGQCFWLYQAREKPAEGIAGPNYGTMFPAKKSAPSQPVSYAPASHVRYSNGIVSERSVRPSEMRTEELRSALSDLDLSTEGTKAELITRLEIAHRIRAKPV